MSAPSSVRQFLYRARTDRLRHLIDAAVHLTGFADPRTERLPAALTVCLGAPGEAATVIDRREGEARTYRFAGEAADLAERIAAVAGGWRGLQAKLLLDPSACFVRSLDLPRAALPRMRALLAEELEAATPFRADAVYSDWFVEGEDVAGNSLRVRHVVIKKARLDPLIDALASAGLAVGPVAVGRAEDLTMPVDLLSQGRRTLPALFGGGRAGDAALWLGAALLLAVASWGFRAHQDATLAALHEAFAAARRGTASTAPPPVQAALTTILEGRAPPLARSWDALAAALPDDVSAETLHLDRAGAIVTLAARREAEAVAALGRLSGFGPAVLRSAADGPDGTRRLIVMLPALHPGVRP